MTATIPDCATDLLTARWTILSQTRSNTEGIYVLAVCSCGTKREVLRRRILNGRSNNCGCQRKGPTERFWRFVSKAGADECWEWQSTRNRRGYGKFWLDGRTDLAHRFSYRVHNGPIPDGLLVRHSCDNPPCVNPAHLSLGTIKDNARDAIERGRYKRGSDTAKAKIVESDVREIHRLRAGGAKQSDIAAQFGISRSAVQFILNGTSWAHVEVAA